MINPATDEVIGQLPHATRGGPRPALAAAQRAFETWRKTSPLERSRILRKVGELARERAKEIGRNITLDQGKPLAEAVGEVTRLRRARRVARGGMPPHLRPRDPAARPKACASWCCASRSACAPRSRRGISRSTRRSARSSRRWAPAARSSSRARKTRPARWWRIARLFHDAGLPPGCLNVVWGVPHEVSDVPDQVARSCARSRSPARCRWASSWPRWPARS